MNSGVKVARHGKYNELVLKKGTIMVDLTQFNSVLNNAQPADFDAASCSASITASAPVPFVSGTKAYAGIKGSVTVTATFAFIGPLTRNGQCNTFNNANLVAQWSAVTDVGSVSFG